VFPSKEGAPIAVAIVADVYSFVIGVDTHARNHVLTVRAAAGQVVASAQFPVTAAGMARALAWAGRATGGDLGTLWVIEGIGSYGARLARMVADAGYPIAEAPAISARTRRGVGKSDQLDAGRTAAAALSMDVDELRRPRRDDGVPAALRVLLTAREHMTAERTATINALTALLRVADLGIDARRPLSGKQVAEVSCWRARTEDLARATARAEAVRLAKRVLALDDELEDNTGTMTRLVRSSQAAVLLDKTGIGPVTAAVALTAWSHHGRLRSEAAFAALAGVNPIPASSGNTVRHRLNRGGDRRLNRALHLATVVRMTHDPATCTYVDKRRAEGRTTKEIRRCLKRYLARQIYRTLNAAPEPQTT